MSSSSQENKSFDYDLIVVGGGPAGVSCAITVAKSGYNVVIVDKKNREKMGEKTCGDAIDEAVLKRVHDKIGIKYPDGNEISDHILKMSIAAESIENKISLKAPGYVVNRLEYGQRLLQLAENVGVVIISSAIVRGILTEKIAGSEYVQGITYFQDNIKKELRAKFTVDASGAYAAIRKRLPRELLVDGITIKLSDEELWPTYREIIELKDNIPDHKFANEILLLYKNNFPPPGYFWIFTKGKRRLNCGIGWMKNQSKEIGGVKKAYLDEMKNYYSRDAYKVLKSGGGQIPVRPPFDSLVFNGGALAGDAACMVHPVTAEGHGPALDSGMNLGFAICNALITGDRSKKALWSYNIAVSKHYALKHMQALLMRSFLIKVGVPNLKYLIQKDVFTEEEMNLIVLGEKVDLSIFEKLKRVGKLLTRPKLLLWLRKIFILMQDCEQIYSIYPTEPEDLTKWREIRNNKLGINY